MSSITRKISGLSVQQRRKDGYVNATQLAKAFESTCGKRRDVNHWLDTDRTKSYLHHLSTVTGFPVSLLIQANRGGKEQGTWIHPKLAVPFATWLSVEFEFLVSEWVMDWINTETTRKAKQSPWSKAREEGIDTRRELTDSIQDYILRHPELTEDAKKWLYARATDDTYLALFGRTAKQLYVDFDVSDRTGLRDKLTKKELRNIQNFEDMCMRLIDNSDFDPRDAVWDAATRLMMPVNHRALRSLEG